MRSRKQVNPYMEKNQAIEEIKKKSSHLIPSFKQIMPSMARHSAEKSKLWSFTPPFMIKISFINSNYIDKYLSFPSTIIISEMSSYGSSISDEEPNDMSSEEKLPFKYDYYLSVSSFLTLEFYRCIWWLEDQPQKSRWDWQS